MASMSIRGIDDQLLAQLKRQAQQEGSSVNGLVVRLLHGRSERGSVGVSAKSYDDLDALAGTWSARQAREFERATAPFSEVDPSLWK